MSYASADLSGLLVFLWPESRIESFSMFSDRVESICRYIGCGAERIGCITPVTSRNFYECSFSVRVRFGGRLKLKTISRSARFWLGKWFHMLKLGFVCLLITIYGEHDDFDQNCLPHNWESFINSSPSSSDSRLRLRRLISAKLDRWTHFVLFLFPFIGRVDLEILSQSTLRCACAAKLPLIESIEKANPIKCAVASCSKKQNSILSVEENRNWVNSKQRLETDSITRWLALPCLDRSRGKLDSWETKIPHDKFR